MKYLFDDWAKVFFRIQRSPQVFLFFDYDGTLTPIVSVPEKARLHARTRHLIKKLQANPRFTLAIISGRSLADIKKMAALRGIIYAGNHGLEIEDGPGRVLMPYDAQRSPLREIRLGLEAGLKGIRGAILEDKGRTLSVHFRLVRPAQKGLVKKIFNKILRPYVLSKGIKISSGKMVLEVRPNIEWDKGRAVSHLLAGNKKALPLYVGDDVTDADGFRAVKKKGISIFVGRPGKRIKADYYLKNPADTAVFIERLSRL